MYSTDEIVDIKFSTHRRDLHALDDLLRNSILAYLLYDMSEHEDAYMVQVRAGPEEHKARRIIEAWAI